MPSPQAHSTSDPARPASAPGLQPVADGVDGPIRLDLAHRIRFTTNAFDPAQRLVPDLIPEVDAPARTVVVIDDGAAAAAEDDLSARITRALDAWSDRLTLATPPILVPGGEASKRDRAVVDRVLEAIDHHHICRRSVVMAVGGGAVLDAVGFAAATAHRGVRLIRFPTTTLAQDDAGIGVKNGINAFGKKNFLGAFAVPWAVVNDETFLATQSLRDRIAGVSEAVKVALLKDPAFFDAIERDAEPLAAGDIDALRPLVRRSAELHLAHIAAGDPFELEVARPLDFGHWSAHRLEHLTDYAVRHGEAVAIGLAIDVDYAARIGRLAPDVAQRIIGCLEALGLPTRHPRLGDADAILRGIEEFREHLGGTLTITLIDAIGSPSDVHQIDDAAMRATLAARTGPWAPASDGGR